MPVMTITSGLALIMEPDLDVTDSNFTVSLSNSRINRRG
jgi:hypothetical protein